MKICVAQTRPFRGDIQSNIDNHKKLISLAVTKGAGAIIFPELSLTGYEPELAKESATSQDDSRFDPFQEISDGDQIIIGAGIPTKSNDGISISMVLFQPHTPRQTFFKKYLHQDEEPFFVRGENKMLSISNEVNIALAICYEISVAEHVENAFKSGAKIYIASVAKTIVGVSKAIERLSYLANKYSMMVLMSNCIGPSGDGECGGKTSAWNDQGILIGQLNDTDEGILMIDTVTQELI